MATCHSVSMMDEAYIGDPLDVKMFEGLRFEIDESK